MLRPLNNNLVVKVKEIEDKTAGGIILSKASRNEIVEAIVVSSNGYGYGEIRNEDTIMFLVKNGTPVTHEGIDYMFVHTDDVLAIIK